MRKEYIVFFSLILAAAITAGSTLSLADNAQALVNYSKSQPKKETVNPSKADKNPEAEENKVSEEYTMNINPEENTKTSYIYLADEIKPVNLTEEQKSQVIAMLKELGMKNEEEYHDFLRRFQEERNLPPTGELDTLTLELIVNQVQLERALRQIKAAHAS